MAAAACACLILSGRLAWLMMARGTDLHDRSLGQRMRTVPVIAPRGFILDRAGRVMAESVTVYGAYAVPTEVGDPATAARRLAPVLDRSAAYLEKRLRQHVAFVWLRRQLAPEQASRLRALALTGIGLAPEVRRIYPYGPAASEVIGFSGIDQQGLAGVELSYNRLLQGTNGAIRVEYDARNRRIPQARTAYRAAVPGNTVVLTLDVGLQEMAQEELRRAMADSGAQQGLILMLDVHTGGILALAVAPSFNPATYAKYPPSRWKNPAVSDTYPPGSTFKPITAAAALQAGVVTPGSGFYDPGFLRVDGRAIRCWKPGGHGSETMATVLRNSCNVALGEIALRLGTKRFYEYLARFGLTGVSGVDLPGEARAILPRQATVQPVDLAVMSFGQTLAVTPLQEADAIAAIANGGTLWRPHVVQEVLSPGGKVLERVAPQAIAHPIDATVARQVRRFMVDVVLHGSGKPAKVPGYSVAGKTGTSQVVLNGRYEPDQYIASFVGYGPMPDPQVLCLVVIDHPQGEHFGGQVAAPVFARLMARALPYLGYAPTHRAKAGKLPPVVVQVDGESTSVAMKRLRAAGLTPHVVGPPGPAVAGTLPRAGTGDSTGSVDVFEGPAPHRGARAPVS